MVSQESHQLFAPESWPHQLPMLPPRADPRQQVTWAGCWHEKMAIRWQKYRENDENPPSNIGKIWGKWWEMTPFGCVWKCCVAHCTQWFCWSLFPMKNGYFIGNIPNIFRQTHLVDEKWWQINSSSATGYQVGTSRFLNLQETVSRASCTSDLQFCIHCWLKSWNHGEFGSFLRLWW